MTAAPETAASVVPAPRSATDLAEAHPTTAAKRARGAGAGSDAGAGGWLTVLGSLPLTQAVLGQRLTAPGGVLLAILLVAPGVLVDAAQGGDAGLPSVVTFLVAATTVPLVVRPAALATAALLPPLLFAGAVTTLAWLGGRNAGHRELVLDVGTTLAFSAPTLFIGTALAVLAVVGRLGWHAARRLRGSTGP